MPEKEPQISVIMSIYNQKNRAQLDEAVKSVLNQSFKDFEFIIYNDGSDDGVYEFLKEYACMDDRIVLINNPVNHGLAYSLNSCIDVARGKYLARMDDDDVCALDRLRIQYEYLEEHPEIAYVGSNAKLVDDEGKCWGIRKMPEMPDEHNFLKFSPYIHPTVMIRRSVFDGTVTYCASKDVLRCEDYELFMRLFKLGYKGYNIQQELIYYREDDNSYKKRKFKYRVDEMRLRYRIFKELGLLFPVGWVFVIRPILAAVTPSFVILGVKKLYHSLDSLFGKKYEVRNEKRNTSRAGKATQEISEDFKSRTDVIGNI